MKVPSVLLCTGLLIVGSVAGFWASAWLSQRGESEAARAGLLAAGDCLRKGDPVCAMTYAQRAASNAPDAYEPYESIGDAYAAFGLPAAARKTYTIALDRLKADGVKAMLVTRGAVSPEAAAQLVRRKLEGTGNGQAPDHNPQQKL